MVDGVFSGFRTIAFYGEYRKKKKFRVREPFDVFNLAMFFAGSLIAPGRSREGSHTNISGFPKINKEKYL